MKEFEYLEVSGTHEDLGRAIGTKFKDTIQKVVSVRQQSIPDYDNYLKKTEPYFAAAEEAFPNLVAELSAIAYAAGVPVTDYFAINNREIYQEKGEDHCTVGVSFGKDGAVVGHNEDWKGAKPTALYILKATVGETTFLGLQYKITIPGVSATMNSWGLVQCINDLDTKVQIGVPKNFVARAICECKTLDEAESVIRKIKRASGFNHVLVQGNEVRNIEIAGDKLAVEKVVGEPYVHTNHYLSPEMKPYEENHTKGTLARYERAKELVHPGMNVHDMQELLSDTKNIKFPIARPNATLGSFVAVPAESKVHICYGPPNAGEYKEYK